MRLGRAFQIPPQEPNKTLKPLEFQGFLFSADLPYSGLEPSFRTARIIAATKSLLFVMVLNMLIDLKYLRAQDS